MKSIAVLALTLAVAGSISSCDPFSPVYENVQCGVGETCPGGMECHRGVCYAESCGDGVIIGEEVCDDGNVIDGDGCSVSCRTATCYVPVTHTTVMSALADQVCSTVYVHSGVYEERLTLSRSVTLVGVGELSPILDGSAAGTVVTVDAGVTATLRGISIRNGKAPVGGGIVNRGNLTLDLVSVTDNTAEGDVPAGGGIANLGGEVALSASTVGQNHLVAVGTGGDLSGAGIFSSGGSVRLDGGSKVEENSIHLEGKSGYSARGGGIGASDTSVLLTGASSVRANVISVASASDNFAVEGGGVSVIGGSVTISAGSLLEDNSISGRGSNDWAFIRVSGGGICISFASLVFESAIIRNNRVAAEGGFRTSATGGGAAVHDSIADIRRAVIVGNAVRADGLTSGSGNISASAGGLAIDTTDAIVGDSNISSNAVVTDGTSRYNASSVGGGVHIRAFAGLEAKTVTLRRSVVDGNVVRSLKIRNVDEGISGGRASYGGVYAEMPTGDNRLDVNLVACTVSNVSHQRHRDDAGTSALQLRGFEGGTHEAATEDRG